MFFRPKLPPEKMLDATYVSDYWQTKLIHQISVDEGISIRMVSLL